jgi:hypothetical protein
VEKGLTQDVFSYLEIVTGVFGAGRESGYKYIIFFEIAGASTVMITAYHSGVSLIPYSDTVVF